MLPNVKVEAGFGSTMFTASPAWTDISEYVRSAPTHRGRSSLDGRFDAGTATLILDNRDGRFNPDNTAGAYYPNVKIGVPIRITHTVDVTTYPLFYGSARSWPVSYAKGNVDSSVNLTLADGFYTLNLEDLAAESYPAQATDTRINAVLDTIGWPAGLRDLDTALATVQATSFALPGDGGEQPALMHLLDVAESEFGVLFMSADGKVTFRNRVANSGVSPSHTFTSPDLHLMATQHNDDYLWNIFRIAREDGAQVEYDISGDAPRRTFTRDVMPMGNDAEVLNVAEWLGNVFGEQRLRVNPLTLKPLKDDTGAFLETILGLELRDYITVQHTPLGGDAIDVDCAVETITHTLTPGDWSTVLGLAPLGSFELQDYWILDVSQLGVSTRLA